MFPVRALVCMHCLSLSAGGQVIDAATDEPLLQLERPAVHGDYVVHAAVRASGPALGERVQV